MRIRTDGDYAYREDAIEHAADFDDCNQTKAVGSACEDVPVSSQLHARSSSATISLTSSARQSPTRSRLES